MVVIVECPECETRYRIDTARLGTSGSLLKCTRCGHMFPPPGTTQAAPPTNRRHKRPKPSSNDSLPLPFSESSKKAPVVDDHEKTLEEPDESFTIGAQNEEPESDEHILEAEEVPAPPPALKVTPPTPTRPAAPARATAPLREQQEPEPLVFGDDEEPPSHPAQSTSERGKLWVLGIFLALTVVGYALVTRMLIAQPALAEEWLGNLPIVGPLATERLLAREIKLTHVTGKWDHLQRGRDSEVFVISGDAVSNAAIPLNSVRVRGRTFDANGKVIDEKTIYCGNAVSTLILNDLSPRAVSVLQQIQPPARFSIDPGAAKSFLIVFMDPPPRIASFTAEVLSARRP